MNIYFVHFLNALLPLFILCAFLGRSTFLKASLAIFLGFLFSYFAFYIAQIQIQTQNLIFNINFLHIFLLILALIFRFKFQFFNTILIFLLSFCSALNYYELSKNFQIFQSSLIDSLAISSLGFLALGLLICIVFFLFLSFARTNSKFSFLLFIFVIICEIDKNLANIFLILMRQRLIEASEILLSFVAKSLYFSNFFVFIYLAFFVIFAFLILKNKVKIKEKSGLLDIEFRKQKALHSCINSYFFANIFACFLSFFILIFYYQISAKPLKIDPPQEITPNSDGNFVFDIELLRDNELHRFAYITSEGKVVRFFLLNKREDRDSPVAVFDACMICGDMGYIKKNGELICISCNVRIFLPSVGKAGGCNPIPLNFEFDGAKITIKAKDVIAGSNFFNEIKEIEVLDPVSKTRLINLKAPFSYSFQGINYYFENEQNYEKFRAAPQEFIDENSSASFLIQRRDDVFTTN